MIDMLVPIDRVLPRLVGCDGGALGLWFFHAELEHGVLELGEQAIFHQVFDVSDVLQKTVAYKALPEGPEMCPCGARQHKGICARALEKERREKAGEGYGITYGF